MQLEEPARGEFSDFPVAQSTLDYVPLPLESVFAM